MRNIIITGGGMVNKGAQAMTLIAVHELRSRFPEHQIYLYSPTDLANRQLDKNRFAFAFTGWYPLKFARCQKNPLLRLVTMLRNGAELREAEAIYRNCDAIVDISGYALGSNWSDKICNDFLDVLEFAQGFDVPVYLMPQSFGPFEFGADRQVLHQRIARLLPQAKVIFAREQEGYDALVNTYGLTNVRLAHDLVLTSREIDLKKVFAAEPEVNVPAVEPGSVGLIPNSMNLKAADEQAVLSIYTDAIGCMLKLGRPVYILSHSSMDGELCRILKEQFASDDRVTLLERELSSLEFNELVKQLRYVVASRFHSIVHAYKNGTPCIALGWATKYHDLLKLFGQEPYIFDVRDPQSAADIGAAISHMDQVWEKESEKIRASLAEVQKENVFDVLGSKE